MAIESGTRTGQDGDHRTAQQAQQETAEQRQDRALEQQRGNPSDAEEQVRREQGGHDRPVGADQKPHPRPQVSPDPQRGLDREVGDLEDPAAEKDGALPGRAGGGLAGG
jgi:hypothetical protein